MEHPLSLHPKTLRLHARAAPPDASAETEAAPSLFATLDSTTPSRMPTGVADANSPITVQNFRMPACALTHF